MRRAQEFLAPALPILREVVGDLPEPRFRPIGLADLSTIADPELAALVRFGPGNDSGPEALLRAQEAFQPFRVAYYAVGGDCILLPGGTSELARWVKDQVSAGGEPARFLQDFVRLGLVQEAARHALDRRYNLARRFAECRGAEEAFALEALAEGRALGITREVARRLGTEAALPLLTERYRQFVPPQPGTGARWLLEQRYRACAWGLAFFDFAEARRIPEAEQRVFAHPPVQVALVQRPELYWQVEAPLRPGLEGRLARQAKSLAHWKWDWTPQPWTADMVRDVARMLGAAERAEKCLAGWQEAGCLTWRGKRDQRAEVAVGAVRFADTSQARAYYALSIDLQREQDKLLNFNPAAPQRVVKSDSVSVEFPGAEDAVRTEKLFQPVGTAGPPIAVTTLLVRAGNLVVLFTWRDVAPDPNWASQLLSGLTAEAARP